jgi:hypothetical protein
MKKNFINVALFFLIFITGYSQDTYVKITSVIPENIPVGKILKVDYMYSSDKEINLSCGINLLDKWEWVSYVGGKGMNVAAGKDVAGSFEIFIPKGTKHTSNLTGDLNYKMKIEIISVSDKKWICGDYPKTALNFTAL